MVKIFVAEDNTSFRYRGSLFENVTGWKLISKSRPKISDADRKHRNPEEVVIKVQPSPSGGVEFPAAIFNVRNWRLLSHRSAEPSTIKGPVYQSFLLDMFVPVDSVLPEPVVTPENKAMLSANFSPVGKATGKAKSRAWKLDSHRTEKETNKTVSTWTKPTHFQLHDDTPDVNVVVNHNKPTFRRVWSDTQNPTTSTMNPDGHEKKSLLGNRERLPWDFTHTRHTSEVLADKKEALKQSSVARELAKSSGIVGTESAASFPIEEHIDDSVLNYLTDPPDHPPEPLSSEDLAKGSLPGNAISQSTGYGPTLAEKMSMRPAQPETLNATHRTFEKISSAPPITDSAEVHAENTYDWPRYSPEEDEDAVASQGTLNAVELFAEEANTAFANAEMDQGGFDETEATLSSRGESIEEIEPLGHENRVASSTATSTKRRMDSRKRSLTAEKPDEAENQRRFMCIATRLKMRGVDKPMTQEHFEVCLEVLNTLLSMWKDTAEPPRTNSDNQKVISLPEHEVVRLTGDQAENSWDISVVSGCRVHVLPRESGDCSNMRKLILLGSPKAIEMAHEQMKDELKRGYPAPPPFLQSRDDGHSPLVRSVWTREFDSRPEGRVERKLRSTGVWFSRPTAFLEHERRFRVDELRPPESWSIRAFGDYVEMVTNFHRTKAPQKVIYDNGDLHEVVARDLLLGLFQNSENRKYFSGRAMVLVMSFLYHHRFFKEIKSLFPVFEEFFTTRSFNTLLRSAAINYNMTLFKIYVQEMKRCGVHPDGSTWVAFLQALRSQQAKAYFLDILVEKGVLRESSAIRNAVIAAITHKYRTHLNAGGSTAEFIQRMNTQFGQDWLSTPAVNKMILETSLTRNLDARNEILRYSWEKGILLNTATLDNALVYYVDTKRARAGINFFVKFARMYKPKLSLLTWQLLWYLGYRKKLYGVCRVVWRYACLHRGAGTLMVHNVLRSLARPVEEDPGVSMGQRFRSYLGKVVVGVIPGTSPEGNNCNENSNPTTPKLKDLCTPAGEGLSIEEREIVAEKLVKQDLNACTTHAASVSLPDMLTRAVDEEPIWLRTAVDVHHQIRRAIDVPVGPLFSAEGQYLGKRRLREREEKMDGQRLAADLEELLAVDDGVPDTSITFVPC